jgi:hypothetical protein
MSLLFSYGLSEICKGNLDFLNDTIKLQLYESGWAPDGYDWSNAHQSLADLPVGSRKGNPATLTGKTITDEPGTGAVFRCDDLTVTGLPAAGTLDGFLLYKDTGVESTSTLILCMNQGVGFYQWSTGADVSVKIDSYYGLFVI